MSAFMGRVNGGASSFRYSGNATYVIRVLVGDQNGIDISDINIDLIKTGQHLASGEAAIYEQRRLFTGDECRISLAA